MLELYQNKEWLEKKYLGEGLSMLQIGKEINRSDGTIHYWLHKFNIPIRPIIPNDIRYRDKKWLYQKYILERLSTVEISKLCNITDPTVSYWLRKLKIPIRSYGEAFHLGKANQCNLSQKAIEWINGELLGDGSLWLRSPHSTCFGYESKFLEYAKYISKSLASFGIKQVGKIRERIKYGKNGKCFTYQYVSRSYAKFLSIRRKWYPEGNKIIPKDLELPPLTIRQWYIGDGSLSYQKNGKPKIKLCTNGFLIKDVEWLILQLDKLGFKATRRKSENTIGISQFSVQDFLNYIGKCPVKCYEYKWRLQCNSKT